MEKNDVRVSREYSHSYGSVTPPTYSHRSILNAQNASSSTSNPTALASECGTYRFFRYQEKGRSHPRRKLLRRSSKTPGRPNQTGTNAQLDAQMDVESGNENEAQLECDRAHTHPDSRQVFITREETVFVDIIRQSEHSIHFVDNGGCHDTLLHEETGGV
ncbi:hypothetical protein WG66_002625 [Moniliophthora roreri]|nr:hypothetical protein WG66_002625 [Moniliophthora roreri]